MLPGTFLFFGFSKAHQPIIHIRVAATNIQHGEEHSARGFKDIY